MVIGQLSKTIVILMSQEWMYRNKAHDYTHFVVTVQNDSLDKSLVGDWWRSGTLFLPPELSRSTM